MYKITLNTKTGKWEIHLLKWWIVWAKIADWEFDDVDTCNTQIRVTGLNGIYRSYHDSYADVVMKGSS